MQKKIQTLNLCTKGSLGGHKWKTKLQVDITVQTPGKKPPTINSSSSPGYSYHQALTQRILSEINETN
jgi:hypothetical protein